MMDWLFNQVWFDRLLAAVEQVTGWAYVGRLSQED